MIRLTLCAIITLWAAAAIAQPPPVYDFCPHLVVVDHGGTEYSTHFGDTCDGEDLVVDHDCPTWNTAHGHEDYYAITLNPGCRFDATVAHTGDAILMVTAECIVYGTTFTCLANSDEEGPGGTEFVTYVNNTDSTATYYLVIDSDQTSGCGTYQLDLYTPCPVGIEQSSWSVLKEMYH